MQKTEKKNFRYLINFQKKKENVQNYTGEMSDQGWLASRYSIPQKKVGRFNGAKNFFQGWRHKQKYNYNKEMNKTGHYYLCSESCVKKEMYCFYFLWWIDQTFKMTSLCFLLMDRLGPFLPPSPGLDNISLTIQTSNLQNNTGKKKQVYIHP